MAREHPANNAVYLLPGRGNRLRDLGDPITHLGFDVYGRELAPPFARLRFAEQIRLIQHDLAAAFWHTGAPLIGHSYGAYLLLHALADREPFPGRILLFAPVLGEATDLKRFYVSRPPRADQLMHLAATHAFPPPHSLELHTGALDDGCAPALATQWSSLIPGARLVLVPDQGHQLASAYVRRVLAQFLQAADRAHTARS
ncbi:MAG: hypothetical protein F9K25_19345 [Candidatus Contendobacter sp.]|nr:MAG: hypothetical protein F9K25_19345 [Candidatus Contendobacter sp.]